MHVGILGGTFDPVHNGHISIAQEAVNRMRLDLVYFLPARIPPMKEHEPQASPAQRYKMIEFAISGNPQFEALDWEIAKQTTCYSIETARLLKKNWPKYRFYWIIGSDLLKSLTNWVCVEELAQLVEFIVFTRPGHELQPPYIPNLIIHPIENKQVNISSTDVRERIKSGVPIDDLVSERVCNYIKINNLYKSHGHET